MRGPTSTGVHHAIHAQLETTPPGSARPRFVEGADPMDKEQVCLCAAVEVGIELPPGRGAAGHRPNAGGWL